jgi:hypothetical protein
MKQNDYWVTSFAPIVFIGDIDAHPPDCDDCHIKLANDRFKDSQRSCFLGQRCDVAISQRCEGNKAQIE